MITEKIYGPLASKGLDITLSNPRNLIISLIKAFIFVAI
jgi:hypothetical protein